MGKRDWLFEISEENELEAQGNAVPPKDAHAGYDVITCRIGKDLHIFAGYTLEQVQVKLVDRTLGQIKEIYKPGIYQWMESNHQELMAELQQLEEKIESIVLSESNYNEFKSLLLAFRDWHNKALELYQKHPQENKKENEMNQTPHSGEGGEEEMGFTIHGEPAVEPGVYEVTIAKIELTEAKYGMALNISFELPNGQTVSSLFPIKATASNKTGRLFQRALGKIDTIDSDELIGKAVKMLIETNEKNGKTYSNVQDIL